MVVSGTRVTSIADVADGCSFPNGHSDDDLVGTSLQVRIVEDKLPIGSRLVDRYAAALAIEELYDLAIGCSDNWRSGGSRNIDRIVLAVFRTSGRECVDQLFRANACNRDCESGCRRRELKLGWGRARCRNRERFRDGKRGWDRFAFGWIAYRQALNIGAVSRTRSLEDKVDKREVDDDEVDNENPSQYSAQARSHCRNCIDKRLATTRICRYGIVRSMAASRFFDNLPPDLVVGDNAAEERLLREYGAVFVARNGVIAPNKVVFKDEEEVSEFQTRVDVGVSEMSGFDMELQAVAMSDLLEASDEATAAGLSITPRGADSARRNYDGTVALWKSRVEPALVHWLSKGRLTSEQADRIRSLPPHGQVPEVFKLEEEGIYFAKDLSKSIIYSVAPPGASQHLSMLAFDVAEFDHPSVRELLARHRWYQTVVSDLPHFTYLGVDEVALPELGLKQVTHLERKFWIPEI